MALFLGWSAALRARRRRCVVALALVVLGAGVGGCNADPPDPGPTWSASVSADGTASGSPTAAPGPVVPVLPAAAREASEAGARAFVGYYWELVNYAQATGDVRRLQRTSAATCDVCMGLVRDIREHYRAGGAIIGGENTVRITEVAELKADSVAALGFRLELEVTHDDQTILDGGGSTSSPSAGVNHFTAYALWVNEERWRLDALDLR
nr:DUF6318 family protein [Pimelobacter simplex]